jgi:hypothetical protein
LLNKTVLIALLMINIPLFMMPAYADHLLNHYTPETQQERCNDMMGRDCFCWEVGNCGFPNDPFGVMLMPFDEIFGGLALVIFWSVIVGILWLRTENPMLVGIVGTAMAGAYLGRLQSMGDSIPAEMDMARLVGGILFAISIGISLYHIITNKLLSSPQ